MIAFPINTCEIGMIKATSRGNDEDPGCRGSLGMCQECLLKYKTRHSRSFC